MAPSSVLPLPNHFYYGKIRFLLLPLLLLLRLVGIERTSLEHRVAANELLPLQWLLREQRAPSPAENNSGSTFPSEHSLSYGSIFVCRIRQSARSYNIGMPSLVFGEKGKQVLWFPSTIKVTILAINNKFKCSEIHSEEQASFRETEVSGLFSFFVFTATSSLPPCILVGSKQSVHPIHLAKTFNVARHRRCCVGG